MRRLALVIQQTALTATPPPHEWHSLPIPGTAVALVLAEFDNPAELRSYVALPGISLLPRLYRTVPTIAVTVLGALYGVVATDTVGDALEKIAVAWPHPWLWEHY